MMRKYLIILVCHLLVLPFISKAQISTIVSWNTATGTTGAHNSTVNNANLQTGVLSRGPALTYNNSSSNSYVAIFPVGQDKAASKAGSYFQVTIQAKPGYYVSLSLLDAIMRRASPTSPGNYRWAYSLDGANFTEVGDNDVFISRTALEYNNGEVQPTIDLSTIVALQYVPSDVVITLRLYAWGGTDIASSSNFGIGKFTPTSPSLAFKGFVTNALPSQTVQFNTNGGTTVDNVVTPYASTITMPTAPTREGYSFVGWYKEAALTNPWDFANDQVKAATTLYAKWSPNSYTVTFDARGGTAVPSIAQFYDAKITAPTPPTRTDYIFAGWYKDANNTVVWDFNTDVVKGNTTLYAKWNDPRQTITFPVIADKAYGAAPFQLTATATSNLPVVYEALTNNININGSTVTLLNTGLATIRATQLGDVNYDPAPPVEISFNITKATQTITFTTVGPYSRYIGTVQLVATSSSGLPVTFSANKPTVGIVNGNNLEVKGIGKIKVDANQVGNDLYLPVTLTNEITIHTAGALQLLVNSALSPNGDGHNDLFLIEGIKAFPENKVKIVNQSGAEVYNQNNYDNETVVFNGTSKGERLSSGTYYYFIEVKQGQEWIQKKGYVVIRY